LERGAIKGKKKRKQKGERGDTTPPSLAPSTKQLNIKRKGKRKGKK
jgi:hypothetical protein